jgi:hypothetical protein
MWCECKGFIAVLSTSLLCACLIVIGMFIQKEASSTKVKIESPKTITGEPNNESH